MKKNSSAKKESEIGVDLKYMREFRAEMLSRFHSSDKRFVSIDKRFEAVDKRFDEMDARFDRLEAKVDAAIADIRALYHKSMLIFEEQNLRNKQAYDGYVIMYELVNNLKNSLKPECFKGS